MSERREMTPEAFRHIAKWLDLMTPMCVDWLHAYASQHPDKLSPGELEELLDTVSGTEVQDDLRRWADEMEEGARERQAFIEWLESMGNTATDLDVPRGSEEKP